MTITRNNAREFTVVTDTMLADGTLKTDTCCTLRDNELRSFERRGDVRTGGLITVRLGIVSYCKITALQIGESVDFKVTR